MMLYIEQLFTHQSINTFGRGGPRSLMKAAAGNPTAKVINPIIRNVHAGPSPESKASRRKLVTVPPKPPHAYTMPFARPRRCLNHWEGRIDDTYPC